MKVHSLKLTVQDMPDKRGELFATVFGTVIIDTGEVKVDEAGTPVLDEAKQVIPILDNINFIVPLNSNKILKSVVQGMLVEALTLKNLEIAKKHGQLSHFIQAIEGVAPSAPKKERSVPPVPRRRTTKKRKA